MDDPAVHSTLLLIDAYLAHARDAAAVPPPPRPRGRLAPCGGQVSHAVSTAPLQAQPAYRRLAGTLTGVLAASESSAVAIAAVRCLHRLHEDTHCTPAAGRAARVSGCASSVRGGVAGGQPNVSEALTRPLLLLTHNERAVRRLVRLAAAIGEEEGAFESASADSPACVSADAGQLPRQRPATASGAIESQHASFWNLLVQVAGQLVFHASQPAQRGPQGGKLAAHCGASAQPRFADAGEVRGGDAARDGSSGSEEHARERDEAVAGKTLVASGVAFIEEVRGPRVISMGCDVSQACSVFCGVVPASSSGCAAVTVMIWQAGFAPRQRPLAGAQSGRGGNGRISRRG